MNRFQIFYSLMLSLILFTTAGAQNTPSLGLDLDNDAYLQVPYSSKSLQISSGQKSIPVRLDLAKYCPPVGNQGDVESCVGWASGYAAMTIERALQNNWTDPRQIASNATSAMFVYNQITGEHCNGIKMTDALDYLLNTGNCLARDFDFAIDDCTVQPEVEVIERAENHKIEEYIRLFEPKDNEKVKNVKLVLAQNKPVIIGMRVLKNFVSIGSGSESWFPKVGDQTYIGGHAMVVVGYDDNKFFQGRSDVSAELKGAFKIMNSWGTEWGQNGFIWVRYAHFKEFCQHAYAIRLSGGREIDFDLDMTPERIGEDVVNMQGAFSFRKFSGQWIGDRPVFTNQHVTLKEHYYSLDQQKVGEQFQLDIRPEFDNGYVYVFSVDPRGKVEVHFPRSRKFNDKFEDQNESAWVMSGGSTITVPTPNSTLSISRIGVDHLIALYSKRKIKPKFIEFLGAELANSRVPVEEALVEILDRFLIPKSDIYYQNEQMGFTVSTTSKGQIVPIILKIEAE